MTVNLQLQVSGGNIETYNIYQNSDLYTVAVATNVTASELSSPYSITLDDTTTFVRLVANGACGTYKDISINFSDPTPSITYGGKTSLSTSNFGNGKMTIATNGKNRIVAVQDSFWVTSDDNGVSWVSHGSNEAGYVICDKNEDFFMIRYDASIFNYVIYKVIGWGGTTSRELQPFTSPFEPGETVVNYHYFNGLYYLRSNLGLYRSEDNVNFIKVLNFSSSTTGSKYGFVGYGNTIYLTTGDALYKSIDDGLNWVLIQSSGSFTNLYVENDNNVLVFDASANEWKFSTNGGSSFLTSWLPAITTGNRANTVIKSAGIYYYQSGSDCAVINHTTTSPFNTIDEFNVNYTVPTANILTTGGWPFNPNGLDINISNNKLFCLGYINDSCVADGVDLLDFDISIT